MTTNDAARASGQFYGWNPFQPNNSGNVFTAQPSPGGGRSRDTFTNNQDQPSPTRASGGFGAPILSPGGGRSRSAAPAPVPTGGPQSVSPYVTPQDITNALGGNPPANPQPRPAPTSQQVAENPGQWAGTSFDPTRSIQYTYPTGGANSLPPGSENVGGVGMYTGSNGPLDTTRFDPQKNLDFVRSIDQVNYQKYVLPWQQGGGNINDPGAVRSALEAGIRGSGGGSYWGAWGGSPYQQYRVS